MTDHTRSAPAAAAESDSSTVLHLVRRAFLAAILALGAMAVTLSVMSALYEARASWVARSREVTQHARRARRLALDHERAVRDFLLRRDSLALAPELSTRRRIHGTLDTLIRLTADDPAQQARARVMATAVERWNHYWAGPSLVAAMHSPSGVLGAVVAGDSLAHEVSDAFQAFDAAEQARYAGRVRRARVTLLIAWAALLAEIGAIVGVLLVLRRQLIQHATALVDEQQHLEEQAIELEQQTEEAQILAQELESANADLGETLAAAELTRDALAAAEREKSETLRLLDLVLANAPVGIAVYDRKGRYRRVNRMLAENNGASVEEHLGRTPHEVVPNLAPSITPILERVLAMGEPVTDVEVSGETRAAPGRRRHWLASYYPVDTENGRTLGVGAMVIETTDRKQLESQLIQSQKMEAVGRLAGGVAHDFNNVLTVIKSYSQILLDGMGPDAPGIAEVSEIKAAADRGASLTKQLLAFSRKQVMQPKLVDLNAVVTDIERMLRRLIGDDLDLVLALGGSLAPVLADPGQIEQVIVNLVVNARDAMPDGGRIVLETSNVELSARDRSRHIGAAPGEHVMLAVSDTGAGIDADTLQHIFEPFFTTKGPGKGTGLGLSTVYGIVKQSGGDIFVHSEAAQGTTFKIYFPAATGRAAVHRDSGPRPARHGSAGETILLVEDEVVLRELSRRVLEQRGYRVIEAASAEQALELCERVAGEIDLLATDLVMSGMDGRALVERMMAQRPGLKVLVMSGYTDDDALRRGMADAVTAFLQKPFTPDTLASKVRDVLDGAA